MSIRLLQVGLGAWGLDWATRVVPSVTGCDQVGFIHRPSPRTPAIIEALGCEPGQVFGSITEAARHTAADAVLIATPTDAHADLIAEALTAGLHVLVEKPFVTTLEQARALCSLADQRQRILMVSQNYRYFPAARMAAELVRSGTYGRLHSVSIDFRRNIHRLGPTRAEWLARQPQPLLMDMAVHHFDLMRMVIGAEPESVSCMSWKPAASSFRDPSCAAALLVFAGGVTVSWAGTWETPGPETAYSGLWRLDFEHAEIHWTCRGDRDLTLDGDKLHVVRENDRVAVPLDAPAQFGRAGALAAFGEAVSGRSDDVHLPRATDNSQSLRLTLAAIESSLRRQPVDLRI